jgi:hypothetical protein
MTRPDFRIYQMPTLWDIEDAGISKSFSPLRCISCVGLGGESQVSEGTDEPQQVYEHVYPYIPG